MIFIKMGQKLRAIRRSLNITQKQLATKLKITASAISNFEQQEYIRRTTVEKLVEALADIIEFDRKPDPILPFHRESFKYACYKEMESQNPVGVFKFTNNKSEENKTTICDFSTTELLEELKKRTK